ncbi:hypothetical protein J3F84DRAFT_388676 [Trichoderma pleuroticola]
MMMPSHPLLLPCLFRWTLGESSYRRCCEGGGVWKNIRQSPRLRATRIHVSTGDRPRTCRTAPWPCPWRVSRRDKTNTHERILAAAKLAPVDNVICSYRVSDRILVKVSPAAGNRHGWRTAANAISDGNRAGRAVNNLTTPLAATIELPEFKPRFGRISDPGKGLFRSAVMWLGWEAAYSSGY